AIYSCSPGPWSRFMPIRTIFFVLGASAAKAATDGTTTVSKAARKQNKPRRIGVPPRRETRTRRACIRGEVSRKDAKNARERDTNTERRCKRFGGCVVKKRWRKGDGTSRILARQSRNQKWS